MGKILNFSVWAVVLGLLGFFFYDQYQQRQVERELRHWVANLTAKEQRARLMVAGMTEDAASGTSFIDLRWIETGDDGKALPGAAVRDVRIRGREIYVDALQIIFQEETVREGDPLRGKSLTVFRGIYGDDQKPRDAAPLDVPEPVVRGGGPVAAGERGPVVPPFFRRQRGSAGALEERLWREVWAMSLDPEYARNEGVQAVQGTAVHKPAVPGKVYNLTITAPGQILFEGPFEPDPFVRFPDR